MRIIAIAVLLALTTTAAADFDRTAVLVTPTELRAYDTANADARIRILDELLVKPKNAIERADLLVKRADLFAARAVHERTLALTDEVARHDARDATARDRSAASAARHHQRSSAANQRAIADYTAVFCAPDDRARGLACAQPAALARWQAAAATAMRFAYVLGEERRPDDAVLVYRRVATRYPTSRHAVDAHLQLAERAFDTGDLKVARVDYRAVATSRAATTVRAYASYKLGWVELNLGNGRAAYEAFRAVIALAPTHAAANAARKDLVRAYALFGTAADAFATLETIAPGRALDVASDLARMWHEQGNAAESLALAGELVRRAPDDARACAWQSDAVVAASLLGERVRWLAEIERLVAVHARAGGDAGCTRRTRASTLDLARKLATEVAATRDRETAVMVDRLFELFARALPDDPDAAVARRERAATRQLVRP